MLKKMLKYDLKYVFKLWVIATTIFITTSIIGALSMRMNVINPGIGFSDFGIIIFILSSLIYAFFAFAMSAYRVYQTCFTDEAYLTFTLPMKRNTILISKILSMLISLTAPLLVMAIVYHPVFAIVPSTNSEYAGLSQLQAFYKILAKLLNVSFAENGWFSIIIIFEAIVITALAVLCALLLVLELIKEIHKQAHLPKKRTIYNMLGLFLSLPLLIILMVYSLLWLIGYQGAIEIANTISGAEIAIRRILASMITICILSAFDTILYNSNLKYLSEKLNLS